VRRSSFHRALEIHRPPTHTSELNNPLLATIALPIPKVPIPIATPITNKILTTSVFRIVARVFHAVICLLRQP
jgi:hypothetical protein